MISENAIFYYCVDEKKEIEDNMDALVVCSLLMHKKRDEKVCKICNKKQGVVKKLYGELIYKYYCEHTTRNVDNQLRKVKKEVSNRLISFVGQTLAGQRELEEFYWFLW